MSEAPKRIWAFHDGPMVGYFVGQSPGEGAYVAEYIRADLVEANLAKAVEAAYREGFLSGTEDGWVNNPRIDVGWKYSRARATLAELKGDKP